MLDLLHQTESLPDDLTSRPVTAAVHLSADEAILTGWKGDVEGLARAHDDSLARASWCVKYGHKDHQLDASPDSKPSAKIKPLSAVVDMLTEKLIVPTSQLTTPTHQ